MTTPRNRAGIATRPTAAPRARLWLGLAAVLLLLGHLLPVYLLGGGISRLDWNSMAARWATGIGLVWDLAMVWVTAGYAALVLHDRRRAGRSGPAYQLVSSVVVAAIAVFATAAMLTTDLSLG
ncbi:hypothetical protein [Nakamurella lactea]|uniref:hypothetical protein n=1 Tax=Nakamurella lactea TaxID=459515 RepID=UPI00041BCF5B|nr:hypothetical protein [Nakamurella lactea]